MVKPIGLVIQSTCKMIPRYCLIYIEQIKHFFTREIIFLISCALHIYLVAKPVVELSFSTLFDDCGMEVIA